MAVHQNMAHGPGLGHIYQRPVNGTVSMRMIFTHGITDDTGAFSVRFIRSVIQLNHGIENSSLHRLQPVSHIRKRTGCNHAHCIIDIRGFHGFFQIHVMNFIKNIIFHLYSHT
jgi:hypothetical protein